MKSLLHFHQRSVEISDDEIRRFLQQSPHSSLTQIIEHLCDSFAQLADTQRLKVWTEVRTLLHRMEEKGMVRCVGEMAGNTWSLPELEAPPGADTNPSEFSRN